MARSDWTAQPNKGVVDGSPRTRCSLVRRRLGFTPSLASVLQLLRPWPPVLQALAACARPDFHHIPRTRAFRNKAELPDLTVPRHHFTLSISIPPTLIPPGPRTPGFLFLRHPVSHARNLSRARGAWVHGLLTRLTSDPITLPTHRGLPLPARSSPRPGGSEARHAASLDCEGLGFVCARGACDQGRRRRRRTTRDRRSSTSDGGGSGGGGGGRARAASAPVGGPGGGGGGGGICRRAAGPGWTSRRCAGACSG